MSEHMTEHLEPIEETKEFATSVYSTSLDSIQMALSLVVALAWYAFIKACINKYFPDGSGNKAWALGLYALIITALFVGVLFIIKKVLKMPISSKPIVYAVTNM